MKKLIAQGKATKEELESLNMSNKMFAFTSAYFKFNHIYQKIEEFQKMRDERVAKGIVPNAMTTYFSYMDAPEGFLSMENVEMGRRTMSDQHFRMEWLSEWQADSNGFYPRKLIDSCAGIDGKLSY